MLPADRHINQAQKRERLPSEAILAQSKDRIQAWWAQAYMDEMNQQFRLEAHASLPLVDKDAALVSVYAGVQVQRMRLRFDQGVSEWGIKL